MVWGGGKNDEKGWVMKVCLCTKENGLPINQLLSITIKPE